MGEPDDDAELLAAYPRLVGMVALYVGDVHVAEDLAQETLVRYHLHRDRTTIVDKRAWLATVALNLARSWWRRRAAELRANDRSRVVDGGSPGPDPADVLAVREAVLALPSRQRAVIVLRFYAGLSVTQTADALRMAEGTVKSLTHRAIAGLRRTLDADVPEELARA